MIKYIEPTFKVVAYKMGEVNETLYVFNYTKTIFPTGELNIEFDKANRLKEFDGVRYSVGIFLQKIDVRWFEELVIVASYIREVHRQLAMDVPNISFFTHYLPYGRQDRDIVTAQDKIQVHTRKFIYKALYNIVDAVYGEFLHSDPYDVNRSLTAPHIWENYLNHHNVMQDLSNLDFYDKKVKSIDDIILVIPDKGMSDRLLSIGLLDLVVNGVRAKRVKGHKTIDNYIVFDKKRVDGKIEIVGYNLNIRNEKLLKNAYVVVYDDICDGGNTFIEIRKALDKIPQLNIRKAMLYTYYDIKRSSKKRETERMGKLKKHYDVKCHEIALKEIK